MFESFLGEVAESRQVMQVNTYGGHPVAAAVAVRNIEIMLEEKLPERAATMGAYLMEGLKDRLFRHGIAGDIRGKGLLIGLKLATNNREFMQHARDQHLLLAGGGDNCVRLLPPLNLTLEEAREAVARFEGACQAAREKLAA